MKKILVVLAVSSVAVSAMATGGHQEQELSGRTISFEDLKLACQHPEQFHNQKAPTNIQLSCRDVQVRWVPDQSSSVTAGTSRHITTSVQSDKYNVGSITESLPSDGQGLACPRFKEVAETMETIRAVSCDDIVGFKGSATDYCLGVLGSLKGASAAQLVDTGNVMDFCAPSDLSKGGQGQEIPVDAIPEREHRSERRGRWWPF